MDFTTAMFQSVHANNFFSNKIDIFDVHNITHIENETKFKTTKKALSFDNHFSWPQPAWIDAANLFMVKSLTDYSD